MEKRRRLNDLILHHDDASAHKATETMEYLNDQRVTVMSHPAYSPDWSPCDFWLFPKIKEQLRGKKNPGHKDELSAAVQEQMDGLRKEDFYHCYEPWFERMNECISAHGHYFEQL